MNFFLTTFYILFLGVVNDSCNDDIACLTMATQDRVGLEAIRSLHRQLDDDADGAIDLSESDDVSFFQIHFYLENSHLYLQNIIGSIQLSKF